jgi:hypothetical protein
MAQWAHGFCIARCKICNKPILYSETIIPKTQYGGSNNYYDPMTSVKKHYRLFHPGLFDTLFRNMKMPIPTIRTLVILMEKKHILPIHGGFNQNCWCGLTHRVVRGLKSHSYRKERKIIMLDDIEKP